jgi:acetyl/propionyl-CoA carboxylase alpha subunit
MKVLIANRAEISERIQRFIPETKVVYTYTDRNLPFAKNAKDKQEISSYLAISEILEAAKDCDAIHPGYGFLSESAEFAGAVIKHGLIFIGPTPEQMRMFGEKILAKELARKKNVCCLEQGDLKDLKPFIKKYGFPLLVKASGGGGGRGMRVVRAEAELEEAISSASKEAKTFFNNSDVFIEPYLENPRHIEVQVIGDKYGDVRVLGSRECSIQRRHQKIIEEAPPVLDEKLLENLQNEALKLFDEYHGLATVEFLLEGDKFYFLEVNTRLQVEHPITEEVTGLDLVSLQYQVACGKRLKEILPDKIISKGHSIEVRVCAEDRNFLPSSGYLREFSPPRGVRVDSGYKAGNSVSTEYDSMLAKVIVHEETREKAISRMQSALDEFLILGVESNLSLLYQVIESDEFKRPYNVRFLDSFVLKEQEPTHSLKRSACSLVRYGKGEVLEINDAPQPKSVSHTVQEGAILSPLPGVISKILVSAGSKVKAGETVLVLESMKMEHPIKATFDGEVKELVVSVGASVQKGMLLAQIL